MVAFHSFIVVSKDTVMGVMSVSIAAWHSTWMM